MFDINNDPLLGGYKDTQQQIVEEYRRKVETQSTSRTPLWDKIDGEIAPLSEDQKVRVMNDDEYLSLQEQLQVLVSEQILHLVKPHIEATDRGKELLGKIYDCVQVAKKKVIQETNKEIEMFRLWQDYSRKHPEATYSEFLNATKKKSK